MSRERSSGRPLGPGRAVFGSKLAQKWSCSLEPEIHSKVSERIMALFVDSRILMGARIFFFLSKEILIDTGSNQGWFNRIWGIANPGCKTSKNMFKMFHFGYTQTSLCLVGRQLFLCKINQKRPSSSNILSVDFQDQRGLIPHLQSLVCQTASVQRLPADVRIARKDWKTRKR